MSNGTYLLIKTLLDLVKDFIGFLGKNGENNVLLLPQHRSIHIEYRKALFIRIFYVF